MSDPMPQSIILFYKYHALSSDRKTIEVYRGALEELCLTLSLKGRILVGVSDDAEGINGTLAGQKEQVLLFTYALLGREYCRTVNARLHPDNLVTLQSFWQKNDEFCRLVNNSNSRSNDNKNNKKCVTPLTMDSPNDFKWSTSTQQDLFPDLNVKLVKEMIGTGGLFSSISINETSQGTLTPSEWHKALQERDQNSVLIDCRNTKECQIGNFPDAVDPNTTTFAQFPQWVQNNREMLRSKEHVYMYCTGGIRCEKASAYLRKQGIRDVKHLKGGIHKYLEEYGSGGLWKGKNFVFDGRGAATATETKSPLASSDTCSSDETVVGRCLYCSSAFDEFHPGRVCTVCREPVLVCPACRDKVVQNEYHCKDHFHLRACYFTNLGLFSRQQLESQARELDQHTRQIAVGRKFKQRRKTLERQKNRVQEQLSSLLNSGARVTAPCLACRNCGDADCSGACWGFHSLKRKEILAEQKTQQSTEEQSKRPKRNSSRPSAGHRKSKMETRQRAIDEILSLGLAAPAREHRDPDLGIRVPPPVVRLLQTNVKGKWCGKSALRVVQEEFADVAKDLDNLLNHGLLRVNEETLLKDKAHILKNMDTITRLVHWHEPPVICPPSIYIQRIMLPQSAVKEENAELIICNKPATVPVHPVGPYLSNSLTTMVEAELQMAPRTLHPCHRIDRVTSGLLMCASSTHVARFVQSQLMDFRRTKKLYIARVNGAFPGAKEACQETFHQLENDNAKWMLDEVKNVIQVDGPIHVADPKSGTRTIDAAGKPSTSRFRLLSYRESDNSSLVVCSPATGRGHQLRVHLQYLGFPILGDVLYGGRLDTSSVQSKMDAAIELIQRSGQYKNGDDNSNEPGPEEQQAIAACRCCASREGIVESFTPAQLLREGHSICLHALRYKLILHGDHEESLILSVPPPVWAEEITPDGGNVEWI